MISSLYGKDLWIKQNGWIYLNASGNDVSISGLNEELQSFSVAAYYYITQSSTGTKDLISFLTLTSSNNADWRANMDNWRIYITIEEGYLKVHRKYSYFSHIGDILLVMSNAPLPEGWQHIAISYNEERNILSSYLNGNLEKVWPLWLGSCYSSGAYALFLKLKFLLHLE